MYEAFGHQDIPTILSHLSEDMDWEYGNEGVNLPWYEERKGRAGAAGFFEALAGLDITLFEPKMFFENGNIVIALLDVNCTDKKTGKAVQNVDEIHIWHFDPDGMVTKFGHRVNTHAMWLAHQEN